jgi:TrmH RNA methyltransferase
MKRARPAPPPGRESHEVTQGLRAGLAVVERRPGDVVRIAFARAVRHDVEPAIRAAASRRIPCGELEDRELDRLAESNLHEGLCVVARPRPWDSAQDLGANLVRSRGRALALDRVRNPYNVGAIVRSAAFFGLDGVILGAPAPHAGLAATAVRVAEGGAENVRMARTTDLADTLSRLRARGVQVVGADGHATTDALDYRYTGPTVLVLGNEREGLADRVRAQCDALVAIVGSNRIESLNVAVAAGVLIAGLARSAA